MNSHNNVAQYYASSKLPCFIALRSHRSMNLHFSSVMRSDNRTTNTHLYASIARYSVLWYSVLQCTQANNSSNPLAFAWRNPPTTICVRHASCWRCTCRCIPPLLPLCPGPWWLVGSRAHLSIVRSERRDDWQIDIEIGNVNESDSPDVGGCAALPQNPM